MRAQHWFLIGLGMPLLAQSVAIEVDAAKPMGPLRPVWRYFGYDEPNYTYMRDGRKLLSELSALNRETVYVRTHNLLTTGDGTAALKWGSTNAYTEDASGHAKYDWTITDRIFDTLLERRMKPLVEIGFMPEALSTHPQPYRHDWAPDKAYNTVYTGWAYPPKDYSKWAELVLQWVKHCVARYGSAEVDTWLWEVWNEPDIGYWHGTPEEYQKLYDYSVDAVRRAHPAARVGGPDSTGPGSEKAAAFLRAFLEHVNSGTNYATGRTGSPLDFISFHAKGRPKMLDGHVQMGSQFQLTDIARGFEIVASFPKLRRLPIILGESDPEGCAACSARFHPQNSYRNGTVYSSYTAATFPRKLDLAAKFGVNFEGAVTWAFEFEGQPYFDGFRDLATNGLDKPVLNVFRMLGMMEGDRVSASSPAALPLEAITSGGVKSDADIGVFASRSTARAAVLVWNYHDDDVPRSPAQVNLRVAGLPAGPVLVRHYRVDADHSNSFEAWKRIGSPQPPSPEQYLLLERAGQLEMLSSPFWQPAPAGETRLQFALPDQAVSLLVISW